MDGDSICIPPICHVQDIVIDNYDSFTYNVIQAFLVLGADISVYRNDEYIPQNTIDFDALIISPGPDHPQNSGFPFRLSNSFTHTNRFWAFVWDIRPLLMLLVVSSIVPKSRTW